MKIGNIRLGCGRRLGSVEAGTRVYFIEGADETAYSILGVISNGGNTVVLMQSDQGERLSLEAESVFTSHTKCLSATLKALRNRAVEVRGTLVEARAARKAAKAAVTPATDTAVVAVVATEPAVA